MVGAGYSVWWTSDGAGGSYVYADTNGDGTADLKIQLQNYATVSKNDILGVFNGTGVISLTPVTGDDTINAQESVSAITLVGSTVGVKNGQAVKLEIFDSSNNLVTTQIFSGAVASNSWQGSVNTSSLNDGATYTFKTTTTDAGGHTVTGAQTVKVDKTPPTVSSISSSGDGITRSRHTNAHAQ